MPLGCFFCRLAHGHCLIIRDIAEKLQRHMNQFGLDPLEVRVLTVHGTLDGRLNLGQFLPDGIVNLYAYKTTHGLGASKGSYEFRQIRIEDGLNFLDMIRPGLCEQETKVGVFPEIRSSQLQGFLKVR